MDLFYMNSISGGVTATIFSLPFTSFKVDPKFYRFLNGYLQVYSNRTMGLQMQKLTKPLNQSFNVNNEVPSIIFENYTDSQKILLLNLYNQTDISYPINPSALKTITGTVTKNEQISPYAEVRLHDKISGKILKKTWADANGAFIFVDILPSRDWYIVAFDDKGEMNAVVLSGVRT